MPLNDFLGHGKTNAKIAILSFIKAFKDMAHIIRVNGFTIIAQVNLQAIFSLLDAEADGSPCIAEGIVENVGNGSL